MNRLDSAADKAGPVSCFSIPAPTDEVSFQAGIQLALEVQGGRLRSATESALAVLLLVVVLPVLVLAALLIKLTSRGPVVYTQSRVGWDGRRFTIYKLRTMQHNCEAVSGIRWSTRGDSRVTRVGKLLRATYIDELPQLINVIRGDMRLVGPRPERPEIIAKLVKVIPDYTLRHRIHPGVTGLAQIQLPADTDLASVRRKLALDLLYIQKRTLWLDVRIVVGTLLKIVAVPFARIRSVLGLTVRACRRDGSLPPQLGSRVERGRRYSRRSPRPQGLSQRIMTAISGDAPLNEPVRADPLGLALVIALTGLLIIRPEELYPPIEGLRLYYILIVCALLYYAPAIAQEFDRNSLVRHPIWVLVLGLFAAVVLSHVTNFRFGQAFEEGQNFGKVAAYYLLLTVTLTSLPALRTFLTALVVFIVVQTVLALCQYHEYIDIDALQTIKQWEFDPDGETSILARLCGSGIYHDPNDLCLLLTAGMLICLDQALGNGGYHRIVWVGLSGLFVYALTLTHSRGGLLAVAAGSTAYFTAKYGTRRAIPILLLLIPVGLAVFAGRQTRLDLSSGDDTGQGRIHIWSDGFILIQSHPILGIGAGQYPEECIYVAHNSFVHAYVELGLVGGGLFLAAFLLAVHAVWTTSPCPSLPPEDADELAQLRPVILGLIVSYMAGMFSLSRNYIPPTYLTLALATVYLRLAAPGGIDSFQFDRRMLVRLGAITVLGFVVLKLFIGAFVQF